MINPNLIHGKDSFLTDEDRHIWLVGQSKSNESIQNDLWLVSQSGKFVPGGILSKNRVRWEKWSDVHTKDKRIRKENIFKIESLSRVSVTPRKIDEDRKTAPFKYLNRLPLKHSKSDNYSFSLSLSLYIYIYILSSTDRLFRSIRTHQCG